MVSAPPLCSTVHGWAEADHIRLCTIAEERRGGCTEEKPFGADLRSTPQKESCINSSHKQVDPVQMNAEYKAGVSKDHKEIKKNPQSMVGSPLSETLLSELKDNVPLSTLPVEELKISPPSKGCSMKSTSKEDTGVSRLREGDANIPKNQSPEEKKNNLEVISNKTNLAPMIQPILTVSPNLQCSSHFKPGQPIAVLVPHNIGSSLGKITSSTSSGTISSVRKTTVSQVSTKCKLQTSTPLMTAQFRPYPYQLSMGRAMGSEAQHPLIVPKPTSTSCSKGSQEGSEQTLMSTSTVVLPLKQSTQGPTPLFTLSIPCEQDMLLNQLEKCTAKPTFQNKKELTQKSTGTPEPHSATRPNESKDMPLDLSSKSKRQKNPLEAECQNIISPVIPCTILVESTNNSTLPKNSTSILPNHVLEASSSWVRGSLQDSVGLIQTYVGVASPVLASTLQGKDVKEVAIIKTLPDSDQKPLTISVINQRKCQTPENLKKLSVNAGDQKCNSKILKLSQQAKPLNHPKDGIPKMFSGITKSSSQNKQVGKEVSHTRKVNRVALLPHLAASVQRRSAQSCPQKSTTGLSKLSTELEGNACKPHSFCNKLESKAKTDDKNAPEHTSNGHNHQRAEDHKRPETTTLPVTQKDQATRQTGECKSIPSSKKRHQISDKVLLQKDPDCNPAKSRDKITKCAKHPEVRNEEDNSVHTNILIQNSPFNKERHKTEPVLEPEKCGVTNKEDKSLSGSNGQCPPVTELEKTTNHKCCVTKLPAAGKIKSKCKKSHLNKQDKVQKDHLKKSAVGINTNCKGFTKEKHQSKRLKNQTGIPKKLNCLETEESERMYKSSCSPPAVKQVTHSRVEIEQKDTPKSKKRRRLPDGVPLDEKDSLSEAPLASSLIRRPRGRPRSTPVCTSQEQDAETLVKDIEGGSLKRQRRSNQKYQNGEYIVETDQVREESNKKSITTRRSARAEADLQKAAKFSCHREDCSPSINHCTRLGSSQCEDPLSIPEVTDKPSGKRKFKSKHISDAEEKKKLKMKRGKRSDSPVQDGVDDSPPKKASSPGFATNPGEVCVTPFSGTGIAETSRPTPPEVRRLIVNKNAGETLLQRAARLGYEEVVHYCLEKDIREVNRRDNAGYTALHEACSRGWEGIVRILLEHGADVNCSAQDGTRPIHDAVVNDNLTVVWMLLNHGADPTLATYSGQTALKLAQSDSMKMFLMEYFADLEGRTEQDPSLRWNFYSSVIFEKEEKACWDFLVSQVEEDKEESVADMEEDEDDSFMFEFSTEPHLPCYHVQVSLSQGYCNWFLLSDVVKRLKTSEQIFQSQYPHFEVVCISSTELCKQVSVSQITPVPGELETGDTAKNDGEVELVRCVPDLQTLLGSSVHCLVGEGQGSADPLCI